MRLPEIIVNIEIKYHLGNGWMNQDPESIAAALVVRGKGILAADETVPTLTKRFDTLGIESTEESRRTYREMLFSATGTVEFGSGVIMADETIRQKNSGGMPLAEFLSKLLKPNMVVAATASPHPASLQQVATATLCCLRRHVPAAVPGIVFLSGGQDNRLATTHLNAINQLPGSKPWTISFSYGRALQDAALEAWRGRDENLEAGQQALYHRSRCNDAASLGKYIDEMEFEAADAASPLHRHGWHDD
jgi:fructose-bisphosphate aldolase class 1